MSARPPTPVLLVDAEPIMRGGLRLLMESQPGLPVVAEGLEE